MQDGYAVLSSDGVGTFPVTGAVRCGVVGAEVAQGTVAYITTGAAIPSGADAVIQIEDTKPSEDGKTVEILKAATPGLDIRTVGSDIQKVRPWVPQVEVCCNTIQHAIVEESLRAGADVLRRRRAAWPG